MIIALPRDSSPVTRLTGSAPLADSLIPKVGHLGSRPSRRSKTPTGKFESIPPSTSHASPPSVMLGQRAGR